MAACSPSADEREWAKATLGTKHLYADYAQLLAHPGLDAVFLVTPNTVHPEQEPLPASGPASTVFCEKPLSLELDECLAVEAEAARHPRLKVMIGYVRRFDASYQDAQRKFRVGQ